MRMKYSKTYKGESQKTYKMKTTKSGNVKVKEN